MFGFQSLTITRYFIHLNELMQRGVNKMTLALKQQYDWNLHCLGLSVEFDAIQWTHVIQCDITQQYLHHDMFIKSNTTFF